MNMVDAFREIADGESAYLAQWYLEHPVVVTEKRFASLKRVQQILHRCICYFVENFSRYEALFPVPESLSRILGACAPFPYRVGTYRPDFLMTPEGKLKICEIGARFPLNGYFMSGIAEYIGEKVFSCVPDGGRDFQYVGFLEHLMAYLGGGRRICVLKGADKPCDIKFYTRFFESLGLQLLVLSPQEFQDAPDLIKGAAVINEFNQHEMMDLSDEAIRSIAVSNSLNDMRTIFLIHDKRFLSVLTSRDFLDEFLSKDDADFLMDHLVPTCTYGSRPDLWENARENREDWVVKHALLGKSEEVHVGCVTDQEAWLGLFQSEELRNMVLQPFVKQRRIASRIGDRTFQDYAVGTMLCFDDEFFGPGIFRTSSHVVTNRVDDRKAFPWFTDGFAGRDVFVL